MYVLSSFLDGMAVGSAGSDGLHVYSAYFNGVYANTTQPSGQWGFYTPDHIFGTVGMFSVQPSANITGVLHTGSAASGSSQRMNQFVMRCCGSPSC